MASVHSSRAKVYERRTTAADEPTKHLESEGERLIKEMVLKQTGTQINLAEQLQQKKHFEKATELVPLTKYTSGEISLKAFQHTAEKASYIEDLKSFGLADEEIEMLFAHNKGEDIFFTKYQKMERSVLKHKLQEIFAKLEAGKKRFEELEKKQREPNVSRHEQELGLAVKPESEETKLYMFALSCQQQETPTDVRPLEHPINQLKELEQQMFGHLTRKKLKKTKNTSAFSQEQPISAPACSTATAQDYTIPVDRLEDSEKKSLWDRKELVSAPTCSKSRKTPVQVSPHKYTCQPKTLYTVRDGKIVSLTDTPKHHPKCEKAFCSGQPFVLCNTSPDQYRVLTREDILGQRLSVDEIKKIPRFEKYEPGKPSKVLFVKNLARQVTETDLVSVFGHLEDPGEKRITCRLMTGRMKGQAFVTFPSTEKSTSALETVNGFLLHDKPMVIQYGNSAGSQ